MDTSNNGNQFNHQPRRPNGKKAIRNVNYGRRTFLKDDRLSRSTLFKSVLIIAILPVIMIPFIITSVAGVAFAGLIYLSQGLPNADTISNQKLFQDTVIYARDGQVLAHIWDPNQGHRTEVPLNKVAPEAIVATLAIEDARFFQNPGVDFQAVVRALQENYSDQGIVSGASTITMQLARNAFFTVAEREDRSYVRKLREVLLAFELNSYFSKEKILDMYFNQVYYGHMAYGIEAAAETYFGKSAKDLNLAEAAYLAGLPQAPTVYDPLVHPQAAKKRQEEVIDAMVYHGFIPAADGAALKKVPVKFESKQYGVKAPHFVQYVVDQLESQYGHDALYDNGWQIYTGLDLNMQQIAQNDTRDALKQLSQYHATNAAVIAIDPKTGEIRTMLGSADFYDKSIDGEVNVATSARQPGSTLKPFNYLTSFIKYGTSPSTVINDTATAFPNEMGVDYIPHNHDFAWHGPVSMRRAMASSLNMPAVIDLDLIGIPAFLDSLHRAGITTLNRSDYGLSVTLGAGGVKLLDLVYAYTVLQNYGVQVGEDVPLAERVPGQRALEPVAVTKIVDSKGKVVYNYVPKEKRIFPERETFLVTTIMRDNEARTPTYGPESNLLIGRPVGVKTGTTEYYTDGWNMGITPDLVSGVWVGNSDNSPMKGIYGVNGAGLIWHNFMVDALANTPPSQFPIPDGVVRVPVWTTDITHSQWTMRYDWFLAENQPPKGQPGEIGGMELEVRYKPYIPQHPWETGTRTAYVVLRPVFGRYQPKPAPPPTPLAPNLQPVKMPPPSSEQLMALGMPPKAVSMRIAPAIEDTEPITITQAATPAH